MLLPCACRVLLIYAVTRDSEVAPGATERTVSISGTPDQIANARRQVEQLFEV